LNIQKNDFEEYKDSFIEDLSRIIEVPSYLTEEEFDLYPTETMKTVLEKTLELFKREGYRTFMNDEGYYGYAEIGEGDLIGILGHLDVVPPGDLSKWETDPFTPLLKDGNLYGRGTQDNKGPIIACLYAMKYLKEKGVPFNKRIRFIFGTDEETLWRGINKYNEIEEKPLYGFAPDSKFPLIYAEKGLVQVNLKAKAKTDLRFKGGDAYNSVPSLMKYQGQHVRSVMKALDIKGHEYKYSNRELTVVGKSVHSQVAHLGINAICRFVDALYDSKVHSPIINFVHEMIDHDPHARKIFGNLSDEMSGNLTCNLGKIEFNDEEEMIGLDLRIPVTADIDEVLAKLKQYSDDYNLTFVLHDRLDGIYVPIDSMIVSTLMESYQEITKDLESQPIASGGATYARALDQCVAFGAVLPGKPKVEHQPNEYVNIDDLLIATTVYAQALNKFFNL
jgi:predicted dipeptidase